MTHTSDWDRRERNRGGILEIVMLALALTLGPAGIGRAQTSPVPADTGTAPAPGNMMAAPDLAQAASTAANGTDTAPANPLSDEDVKLTTCATCGGSGHLDTLLGLPMFGSACPTCGGRGTCVPGRRPCFVPAHSDTVLGRFCTNFYQALCCPDPCFQPGWIPQENAAFFQDYAQPYTVTRLRWDHNWDMAVPDRAEFFWAKQNIDATQVLQVSRPDPVTGVLSTPKNIPDAVGKGPKVPPPAYKNYTKVAPLAQTRYPAFGALRVSYDDLYLYQEVAANRASFFVEGSYLATDPRYYTANPNRFPADTNGASMFGDMNFGAKAAWIDTEILLFTFQFKAIMPTGNPGNGLGTGHVSLEPSLMTAVKLTPDTYFQGQLAEWIPIGGTPAYQGSVLHYHAALDQVLWRPVPNSMLIGTAEFNGYSFQAGSYTDPILGPYAKASGQDFCSAGPGLRFSVCNRYDFGGAVAFPLTDTNRLYSTFLRVELRVLY